MNATVVAVNISAVKGTPKTPVEAIEVRCNHGAVGEGCEVERDVFGRDRVAHRDHFGRALCRKNPRYRRRVEDVAFFAASVQKAKGGRLHDNPSSCNGDPFAHRFFADVRHPRAVAFVKMCQ